MMFARRSATLAGLLLLTIIAACGDDDDSTDPDATLELSATASGEATSVEGTLSALDACTLLSEAELAPLLGSAPAAASGSGDGITTFACAWTGSYGDGLDSQVTLQVTLGTSGPGDFDQFKDGDVEEVGDVGEEAYVELAPPGNEEGPNYHYNALMARDGDYYVTLAAGGPLRDTEATTALSSAAQVALGNLPEAE